INVWTGVIIPGMLNDGTKLVPNVKVKSIVDGTSNTVMRGEKCVPVDHYQSGATWGDNEPWAGGNSWTHTRHASQQPRQDTKYASVAPGTQPPSAASSAGKCGPWGWGTTG